MNTIDCVIVGAGVVGLACAAELAGRGMSVAVLESESAIGTGVSSRNSEVIHAGIYYAPGSLKAQCCVEGRTRLYDYARRRGIGHRQCGKLIVAENPAQHAALEAIMHTAQRNGVDDLRWLDADAARALEPALACSGALLSPSTGIIDSHALMLSLVADIEAGNGFVACRAPVRAIRRSGAGTFELDIGGDEPMQLRSLRVINSAGLGATALAGNTEGLPVSTVPTQYFSKGNYFALSGVRAPFTHLIYPVPQDAWLGVHLTLDLAGQARFGPDSQWTDALDYHVDPKRAAGFYDAIRRYWPGLPDTALVPAYAGMRPKIHGPGEPAPDFALHSADVHGIDGLVNLFGIESPGLTSALAIARRVAGMLAA